MPEIRLSGLCKSFRQGQSELPVLRGLDLVLPAGEITVIVGKSGCGKTTLLRIIAALEQYDSGELLLPTGCRIGMVFQEARLMPWLTVGQNIAFSAAAGTLPPERIAELVALTGLAGFEKARPRQLSGGMQQRAALARALAFDPDWLLMDEPFSALDYFTRISMQRELLRIRHETGKSIAFVTHSIDEALAIGDRILLLREGRIAREYVPALPWEQRELTDPALTALKRMILMDMEDLQ